jgi:hypothetical protein
MFIKHIKKYFVICLIISLCFNVYFLIKKVNYLQRQDNLKTLYFYKNIVYNKSYNYFIERFNETYPEKMNNQKLFFVYSWDSLSYEVLNKSSMKSLDSLASIFGKRDINYVFATEMDQNESDLFLKRDHQNYKNFNILGEMDDFISGLYYNKDIKITNPKSYTYDTLSKKMVYNKNAIPQKFKRKPFYILMDHNGDVVYYNKKLFVNVLYDSVLINTLRKYSTSKTTDVIN